MRHILAETVCEQDLVGKTIAKQDLVGKVICQQARGWDGSARRPIKMGRLSSPPHKAGTAQLGWRDGSARPTSQALEANSK